MLTENVRSVESIESGESAIIFAEQQKTFIHLKKLLNILGPFPEKCTLDMVHNHINTTYIARISHRYLDVGGID